MNIKEWLAYSGLSCNQLAIIAGLSPQSVLDYSKGKRIPHLKNAKKIEIATKGKITVKDLRPTL